MSTLTKFANPYLVCDECDAWITGAWNLGEGEGPVRNEPCGHKAGATSRCPSWGPVDGCECLAHLGHVPHSEP